MSEAEKTAPRRTSSGNHPAVREFRHKLDSVSEGVGGKFDELDEKLSKYLEEVKSVPPPAKKAP
jgi:hypothetical protein